MFFQWAILQDWLVGVEAKANRARCRHHRGQDRSGALEWPVPGLLQDHGLLVPVGSWVPDLQRRQVQAGSNLSRFTVDIGCFFWGGTCLDSFGILKTLKYSIYFP